MIVDCAHYRDGQRQNEGKLPLDVAETCVVGDGDFVWLGLHEPSKEELLDVGRRFNLHELALEDAYVGHQRPKLEDYDGSFFIVLRPARYVDEKEEVEFGEIHVFISSTYVITVRHGEASGLQEARARVEKHSDLLDDGPAAVVWAILDKVVDDYRPVTEGIDNDIVEVEQEIFQDAADSTQRIYFLKREVIEFHHAVGPLLAPLEALERGAFTDMSEQLRRYFRDVADHARRIDEEVTAARELLTSILEANLALLAVKQNEVVRKISAWAAIITVPTFIGTIYGMNFEHMPELDTEWAYPAVLVVMLLLVLVLHRFFKRIHWL